MDGESEDFDNVEDRAKKLSELTGRDYEDVLTDLLDDGKLNNSNMDEPADLVEQLKGAAELIATVQNISKDIQDNSVLNGGENETVVEVKTTLEGDIVDRAIESVQRKAENLKKIGLTLIPIFLLLTGGTMETFGMIDIFGGDESNGYDDGCSPEWFYDEYGYSFENQLEVRYTFIDYQYCDIEFISGHFIIQLFYEGEMIEDTMIGNQDFTNEVSVEHTYFDLEQGQYHYRVEFHTVDCEDGSCEHGDEYYLQQSQTIIIDYQEPELCDAYLINEQAYLLEEDDENDAVKISADVALLQGERNCDSEQFEIIWRLYEYNNPSVIKYEHITWESGVVSDPDGADYVHHTWDAVDEGSYEPKVVLLLNGEVLDEKLIAHTITIEAQPIYGCTDSEATNYDSMATDDDGSCEYPPEVCEINLYYMMLETNSTHATVAYDLDCGYQQNELEGYNVSVQFLVFEVGSENNTSSQPIVWDTTLNYVQGWEYDNNSLTLTNFTESNNTHYDFYWYATWIDGEGESQMMQERWLNRELNP